MSATASTPVISARPIQAPRLEYPTNATMAEARAEYFRVNAFGEDGGYGDKWVDFKLGPIPFPFPNSAGRVRAVRFHDLHHILTGYRTDFIGELEISAFEIGSGCADMYAAWGLNLGGLAMGALLAPKRTFRAFMRGRHSKNLYRHTFDDALLARNVGELRAELGVDREIPTATLAEVLLFLFYWQVGWISGTLFCWLFAPLAPFGWLAGRLLRK